MCEIHNLRLFDCAIGRRGLLAACPAFEKYPQLIDVSGAGALSPASRLVIIGFGTGSAPPVVLSIITSVTIPTSLPGSHMGGAGRPFLWFLVQLLSY